MNDLKISISKGNIKLHDVTSFSLPPVTTCRKDAPCKKDCYACKIQRLRPAVKAAYERNYKLLKENPESVFKQLEAHLFTVRFFRFHVSGDFYNAEYFSKVMDLARSCNWCRFIAFTKQYEIANDYIKNGGTIPENFNLIFSAWGKNWKFPNPYNLPVAEVIFKGEEPNPEWLTCGGNCQECSCKGVGCWQLKKGETIYFNKH